MADLNTPVAFLATAKSTESRHFYETVLNLKCLSDEPFALVFELGGTTLRIQKVESVTQVNYTVLGWNVTNIKHCVEELAKKGVQFEIFSGLEQDDSGIWSSPGGAMVAWFKDPDGNTLSLTQL
ncbi:MAG: VOC family protein [Gammaproteobacteria bacterium]|nr:VOC family protein [Gammaproteobacteria bacterium]